MNDITTNTITLSEAGIVGYDGLGGFLVREIITPEGSGLSITNSSGVKGNPTLTALKATTTSPGIVQLADKEAIKQGTASPTSVLTVDNLENLPSFWVCFRVRKQHITFLKGYNVGPENLHIEGHRFIVFNKSSKTDVTAPVLCTAWSNFTYNVSCQYSIETQAWSPKKPTEKGTKIIISPLFTTYYWTIYYDVPVTIQVVSYESW